MLQGRSSGILLHPTSLPGPNGIGDLGPSAYRWIDTLAEMGCGYWQLLPLGPTGYGDSPYQCFSSFAGNTFLISPELLVGRGLIDEPTDRPAFPDDRVDFGPTIDWKLKVVDRAYDTFIRTSPAAYVADFDQFIEANGTWLHDYALFIAIKALHDGRPFWQWAPELRDRHPAALARVRTDEADEIRRIAFGQFLFFQQWNELHTYANRKGVAIIGDLPIFVAADSADVWANRDLFELDEAGSPTLVAGVPPDYFSPTGQLWGNPQYRWDRHSSDGFQWWLERLGATLGLVDLVRIDHFRAFADYWEIPADAPTAETGRWVAGPGSRFFEAVGDRYGDLPIIAEDLGEISPAVFALRDQFGLPGMKILQFAFDGDSSNPFLPHNYPANCVVYTGTHDNDTTRGWWDSSDDLTRHHARIYLETDGVDISWDLIAAAWHSSAALAIAPIQDLLSLDGDSRMNVPGEPSGNWRWRMAADAISDDIVARTRDLNHETDRS